MQTELLSKPAPKEIEELRALLAVRGWQTRSQISRDTGWSERKIRDVCESMGEEVVRGQPGFKLTAQITREELASAKQAADAAISQAKKQMRYGIALLRKIHGLVG